jgi:hypothetical protein
MRKTDYTRRLEAWAVYAYGAEFLRVATKAGSGLVRAYLFGHALELLLKAYLLSRGKTPSQLRESFGHNLAALLSEAKQSGLGNLISISPQLEEDLKAFSEVYASKRLEYFSTLDLLAPWRLPEQSRLARFVRGLAKQLNANLPRP